MKYSRAAATLPTPAQFPRISTIDGDSQQRASQRDDLTRRERTTTAAMPVVRPETWRRLIHAPRAEGLTTSCPVCRRGRMNQRRPPMPWSHQARLQPTETWRRLTFQSCSLQLTTSNNDNVDNLFVKELQTIPLILKLYIWKNSHYILCVIHKYVWAVLLSVLPQVQIDNHWCFMMQLYISQSYFISLKCASLFEKRCCLTSPLLCHWNCVESEKDTVCVKLKTK